MRLGVWDPLRGSRNPWAVTISAQLETSHSGFCPNFSLCLTQPAASGTLPGNGRPEGSDVRLGLLQSTQHTPWLLPHHRLLLMMPLLKICSFTTLPITTWETPGQIQLNYCHQIIYYIHLSELFCLEVWESQLGLPRIVFISSTPLSMMKKIYNKTIAKNKKIM